MLQEIQDQVQEVLRRSCEEKNVAGVNVLFLKDNKEQLYCEAGFADAERKLPVRRDSIFRLYSMSKPFTAAAAMILMERGIIDLMDPVSRYLPEYKELRVWKDEGWVPANREITLYDLLSMQSGLPYGGETPPGVAANRLFEEDPELSTREFAREMAKCGLNFQPGDKWQYGSSADVMGAVIEEAAGCSFRDFLKKELFDPLEMPDTDFYVPEEKRDRLARTYYGGTLQEDTKRHLQIQCRMETLPAFQSGGAGIASTIDDSSHFTQMLLNGGTWNGKKILSAPTVAYMRAGQLTEPKRLCMGWDGLRGYSYGNFMRVLVAPGEGVGLGCAGEYGWDGWLGTYFANFPEQNATILMMMQKMDAGTWQLTRAVRNVLLASLE